MIGPDMTPFPVRIGLAEVATETQRWHQDEVNASLLILLKNPYWSPFDPHWCSKNQGDLGRFGGFSAESTFDRLV